MQEIETKSQVVQLFEKRRFAFGTVANGGAMEYVLAKAVDITEFPDATLVVRIHDKSVPAESSVEVIVKAAAPTCEDPSVNFVTASSVASVSLSDTSGAPGEVLLDQVRAGAGGWLQVLVKGNQGGTPPNTFYAELSADLVLRTTRGGAQDWASVLEKGAESGGTDPRITHQDALHWERADGNSWASAVRTEGSEEILAFQNPAGEDQLVLHDAWSSGVRVGTGVFIVGGRSFDTHGVIHLHYSDTRYGALNFWKNGKVVWGWNSHPANGDDFRINRIRNGVLEDYTEIDNKAGYWTFPQDVILKDGNKLRGQISATIHVAAGNGMTVGGPTGDLHLEGGTSGAASAEKGGDVYVSAGVGGGTGTGGAVAISGGAGGTTSGDGGGVTISGGSSAGGDGGDVSLHAGTSSTGGQGGQVALGSGTTIQVDVSQPGDDDPVYEDRPAGGDAVISGGALGDVAVDPSVAQGAQLLARGAVGKDGGAIEILGGDGDENEGMGGGVSIRSGKSRSISEEGDAVDGASIEIIAGDGENGGNAGEVDINAGDATGAGDGGSIRLRPTYGSPNGSAYVRSSPILTSLTSAAGEPLVANPATNVPTPNGTAARLKGLVAGTAIWFSSDNDSVTINVFRPWWWYYGESDIAISSSTRSILFSHAVDRNGHYQIDLTVSFQVDGSVDDPEWWVELVIVDGGSESIPSACVRPLAPGFNGFGNTPLMTAIPNLEAGQQIAVRAYRSDGYGTINIQNRTFRLIWMGS